MFQVTGSGAFNEAVGLSCSGLPPGAACNFQPSGPVSPVSGSPASVTVTISTSASTPAGTSAVAINGSVSGGPVRTQNLALTVTPASTGGGTGSANFILAISNPSLTRNPGEAGTFNGTLTAVGGYGSAVNLSCADGPPPTCAASPARLTPTSAGTVFTLNTSSDVQNHFNFQLVATGTDATPIVHFVALELIVGFNFALNNNSPARTIQAGQTASFELDALPLGNGSTFPSNVSLSCSSPGLPPLSTCAFTPSQVASGSGDTNVLLNITTTAATTASGRLPPYRLWYDAGISLAGIVLAFGGLKNRKDQRKHLALFVLCLAMVLGPLAACGGGSGAGGRGCCQHRRSGNTLRELHDYGQRSGWVGHANRAGGDDGSVGAESWVRLSRPRARAMAAAR